MELLKELLYVDDLVAGATNVEEEVTDGGIKNDKQKEPYCKKVV